MVWDNLICWSTSSFRKLSITYFNFGTIVFIFIIIPTTLRPTRSPAFSRCLPNSGTFTKLPTTSLIEPMEVACSDSVSHNHVQVLSIPVLLLACSQAWTCNLALETYGTKTYNRYAMCSAGHIVLYFIFLKIFFLMRFKGPYRLGHFLSGYFTFLGIYSMILE